MINTTNTKNKFIIENEEIETEKPYRGTNLFLLWMVAGYKNYNTNYWVTYKQAKDLGGIVKKGEKSTAICFWNVQEKEVTNQVTREKETKKIPYLKYYRVFNLGQTEGLEYPVEEEQETYNDPIHQCEYLICDYINRQKHKPVIKIRGHQAFYNPKLDLIQIPERDLFVSSAHYY